MTATADIRVMEVSSATLAPNAALRFTAPSTEKKPARPGGLVGSLFARPPRSGMHPPAPKDKSSRVYILEKDVLKPIPVTIGATDGTWTQILSGKVTPGMNLVVDQAAVQK